MMWRLALWLWPGSMLAAPLGPCVGRGQLPAPVAAAATTESLWSLERSLVATPPCEVAPARSAESLPAVGTDAPEYPIAPTGAGIGPWILVGLGAALGGAVLYLDASAEPAREDMRAAARAGDQLAYAEAYADYDDRRKWALGLAVGGGAAVLTGVVWAWLGSDADPVQSRPWFSGQGVGWGGRF